MGNGEQNSLILRFPGSAVSSFYWSQFWESQSSGNWIREGDMNSNVLSLQQKREREQWVWILILEFQGFHREKYNHRFTHIRQTSRSSSPVFFFFFGELIIKHCMEIGEITCYRRYIDDIIIIFDQNKINEDSVTNYMNNVHKYLTFIFPLIYLSTAIG